jgi:AraC-like DNA-binding protein
MDIRLTYSDLGSATSPGPLSLPSMHLEETLGKHRIDLRSGSWCRFDAMPTNHPHLHRDVFEFSIVAEGSGLFIHGKERHRLARGSVFVADPDVVHEIRSPSRDLLKVYFVLRIDASRSEASSRYEDALLERFMRGHHLIAGGCEHLLSYLALFTARGDEQTSPSFRQHQLMRLVVFECIAALLRGAAPAYQRPSAPRSPFARACAFIERNLHRAVAVEEVARHAGCSQRQLRRIFRDRMSRTLIAEINDRRLNLAAQHLLMRFSISEAAQAIGITSTAQFGRMFKQRFGQTPLAYQRLHAAREAAPKTVSTPPAREPARPPHRVGSRRSPPRA